MTVFALLLASLLAGSRAQSQTELLIRAVDRNGQPVRLTRADLYFDVWGGNDVTHLSPRGNTVRIGLAHGDACALEPTLCANHPTFSARILLEAEGLVPVSSDLFEWMTDAAQTVGLPPTEIRLPGAAPLRFRPGTRRDVTIRFRAPQPRMLRVTDARGRPVPGAQVTIRNFFADSNHMGAPEGDVILDDRVTDSAGTLAVPDGDITYGVAIHKQHWEIVHPRPRNWPDQLVARIDGPSFDVVMRRHTRSPLLLRFERDGAPAADLPVSACVTPCGGACCGPLGKTDAAGNLTIREFYPEEYDRVLVPVKEDDYKSIWQLDPRTILDPLRRLTVTLPKQP